MLEAGASGVWPLLILSHHVWWQRAGTIERRRGVRAAEGDRLENGWAVTRLVGSNPTPSAIVWKIEVGSRSEKRRGEARISTESADDRER